MAERDVTVRIDDAGEFDRRMRHLLTKAAHDRDAAVEAVGRLLAEIARCACMDGEAQQTAIDALGVYEHITSEKHEQRRVIRGDATYGAPGSEVDPKGRPVDQCDSCDELPPEFPFPDCKCFE